MQRHKEPEIGCGFNIVPMWHPLRLAEDYPLADILTGGRVIYVSQDSNRQILVEDALPDEIEAIEEGQAQIARGVSMFCSTI